MQRNARGNMIKPPLHELCSWIRNSWEGITPEMVRIALVAGYVGAGLDFLNAYIGGHETYGPLIASMQDVVVDSSRDSGTDDDDALLIDAE